MGVINSIRALTAGVVLMGCGHADALRDIFENPERAHGRTVRVLAYPFDTEPNIEKETFLLCFDPCPQPCRFEPASVLCTNNGARYRGMNGTQPVVITLRFDASCFERDAFCHPHYPFVFDEVE